MPDVNRHVRGDMLPWTATAVTAGTVFPLTDDTAALSDTPQMTLTTGIVVASTQQHEGDGFAPLLKRQSTDLMMIDDLQSPQPTRWCPTSSTERTAALKRERPLVLKKSNDEDSDDEPAVIAAASTTTSSSDSCDVIGLQAWARSGLDSDDEAEDASSKTISSSASPTRQRNTCAEDGDETSSPSKCHHPGDLCFTESASASSEYFVYPALPVLQALSTDDARHVENLIVGHSVHGHVEFLEPVDLTSLPSTKVDEVVAFDRRQVTLYPRHSKPSVGSGLNVPALITLNHVFPTTKATGNVSAENDNENVNEHANESENAPMVKYRWKTKAHQRKFEKKIAKKTADMGATLCSYDSARGVWKFKVESF
eukprot:GFYU01003289.1.p1 GENE.GFYU01003289.1~~GFYU01003289.1.p1  ORF type:complete len:407 (-),score=84.21 GFYU01003289.1:154-1257(-)